MMRPLIAMLILACGLRVWIGQERTIDATKMSHWELGLTSSDADISPDDSLLAVTLESRANRQDVHAQVTESVEVWDYRENRKINRVQLASYPKTGTTPNAIRFTVDGSLLVASEPTKLHVLDASSLTPLRVIEPPIGQDFRIFHVETGPIGHIAVVAANYYVTGMIFAYNLDTGSLLFQSESLPGVASIAWNKNGTLLAAATPLLCGRSRDNTVQVFRTNPWSHLRTLSARNPVSVAFSQDRLFLVESGWCKGSLFNRHLGLEAFDTTGWHRQRTLFLPNDIHDSVSFADGRLLADTGELKATHDWLDGTTTGVRVDEQFTIWNGEALSLALTSPAWPVRTHRLSRSWLMRLSRTGKAVLLDPQNPQVFQLP